MINLLPVEEKKILVMEERWRMVLIMSFLFLSFFLCLILILFSIKFYIAEKVESQKFLVETEKKQFEELESLREDISVVNKNFQKLNTFYQKSNLSDVLEKISNTLYSGMYLKTFSYQKQSSDQEEVFDIVISGFAPDRTILFNFTKDIENNFSTKVDPEKSVIIKPQDFRLVFKIKMEKTP